MTVTQPAPGTGTASHGPWAGYWQLPEPLLAFDPVNPGQRAVNPLAGLAEFGPYSASNSNGPHPSVRVALLAPDADLPALRGLLRELWYPQQPRERTEYLPPILAGGESSGAASSPPPTAPRSPSLRTWTPWCAAPHRRRRCLPPRSATDYARSRW